MDGRSDPLEFSEPMPCYEFHETLEPARDDGGCVHCRKFLTLECPYIEHFMTEEDE